jgi:hypothetical protein
MGNCFIKKKYTPIIDYAYSEEDNPITKYDYTEDDPFKICHQKKIYPQNNLFF